MRFVVNKLKIHPLASVDSQLLYRSFQPLDGNSVFEAIIDAAKSIGLAMDGERLETTTEHDLSVRIGDLLVSVTQSIPFSEDDYLQVALDTFSFENSLNGIPSVDEAVTACTHVSVQKDTPSTERTEASVSNLTDLDLATFSDSGEALRAMELAKSLALLLSEKSEPDAIFWGPSTFLLDPGKFKQLAASRNPLLLYLHCHVYTKEDSATDQKLVGVIASGAQWLIGRSVEFKPASLPAEYLVEKVYDFVAYSLKNEKTADNGDVFGKDDSEKVAILAHQSDGHGPDKIELKVVHNPEFGISREIAHETDHPQDFDRELTGAPRSNEEDPELNPNDPVDAAILERLAEINAEEPEIAREPANETRVVSSPGVSIPATSPEPEAPVATVQDEETPEQEAVTEPTQGLPVEEQRPVRKARPAAQRMSMAELRDFAKEAQVPQPDRDVSHKKRGFIGKIFSKKSG